jgi:protein TonB
MARDKTPPRETLPPPAPQPAADFLAAHAPGRNDAADGGAASNVVPFDRGRRRTQGTAPAVAIDPEERRAPAQRRGERLRLTALLVGSLLLHSALFAAFNRAPEDLPSAGVVALSVEIVVGADTPAGLAATPSESEAQEAAAPAAAAPAPAQRAAAEPSPITPAPGPEAELQAAEARARPDITHATPDTGDDARKEAPPQTREETPARDKRRAQASAAAQASSGIGRGRSQADANYHGLVAAHLARHKRYPAEARSRGEEGRATLTFSLDGAGRVTAVRLVRSSGHPALDRESEAMVRRASPFPAPPARQAMSFTVPVTFNLR